MNVLEWLVVVVLSLCTAVLFWKAVTSVADYRRNKARREQALRDAPGEKVEVEEWGERP